MDKPVEIYLASIWQYQDAGVKRILDTLHKQHPAAKVTFEEAGSWFKVVCPTNLLRDVQSTFRAIHETMEEGFTDCSATSSNPCLIPPPPSDLPSTAPAPPVGESFVVVDQHCPASFDKYNATKVWSRVKDKTPDTITVHAILGAEEKDVILDRTGVHLAFDVPGRLVYMGGPSRESLDRATKMLDNMFNRFLFEMPQPRHLLYAEAEGPYTVDARFVAHVNQSILTSTILDPGQYPDEHLDRVFKALFSKAVCLRICLYDHFRRGEVSFFGPRAQPIFRDQARRWPLWFRKAEYAPKVLGVTFPKEDRPAANPMAGKAPATMNQGSNSTKKPTDSIDANQLSDKLEQLAVGPLDVNKGQPAASPAASGASTSRSSSPVSVPLPPPPPADNDKHGYQMKLLWEFVTTANKNATQKRTQRNGASGTNGGPAKGKGKKDGEKKEAQNKEQNSSNDTVLLVDVGDSKANESKASGLLIPIDEPPPVAAAPPKKAPAPSVVPSTSMSRALVHRTAFQEYLHRCLGQVVADLPYRKGRIRMQAELGRIYIMDATPEGLAFNLPGEPARGWTHTEIMTRLDTLCVAPESVVFTKVLSIFANDIETIIGSGADPSQAAAAAAAAAAKPSAGPSAPTGNLLGEGNEYGFSESLSPEWRFHEKRVVYELKCQRFLMTNSGTAKAQPQIVVEIDGTEPAAFKYSIRGVRDNRPPIWIHCIRRHWDARILVSYSDTDKLEEAYGDFARELLREMVVPPGPMTNPRFEVAYNGGAVQKDGKSFAMRVLSARVRNVGRFISADGESYLDVSWNRHMRLENKRQTREKLTIRATPAADDVARGMFASWYEAGVVGVRAEEAFRENETLAGGDVAAWGRSRGEQEVMFDAMFKPALELVQKMDGVGVLIDNGLGETLQTPPRRVHTNPIGHATAGDVTRFW